MAAHGLTWGWVAKFTNRVNGAGGGFESFANFHGGNAANISEFNDGSSPASGKGTPGRDRGENSFAVD